MIHIVIPVHNRKDFTRGCLQCMQQQQYKHFQVIIVDDGSTDGTSEMIAEEFPEVIVLRGDGNLWWTEATNLGIRHAQKVACQGEENFILTLNDDTLVKPDYLDCLMQTYKQFTPCLVGSASVDVDRPVRLLFTGTRINMMWTGDVNLADHPPYCNDYTRLVNHTDQVLSDSLPGRGTLISFTTLAKIGLFDSKHYPHYLADIEFSVRAKKAGYQLVVSTKAVVSEYVKATGLQIRDNLSFKEFIAGLFSIRSSTQLKPRYHFAMKHAPTRFLYFVLDTGRIIGGYAIRRYKFSRMP